MTCADDCACNNAVVASLMCVQSKGASVTAAQTMACFTAQLGGIATETATAAFIPCLTKAATSCGAIPAEGGTDGGDGGGTTTDGGDGGGSTTDGGDGGGSTTDGGASDAPTG